MESNFLTPEETAMLLKISKYTVYEMVKRGQIPAKRLGRKLLIQRVDIDQMMAHGSTQQAPHTLLTPAIPSPTTSTSNTIYFSGSHDLSIDVLIEHLNKLGVSFFPVFSGSLEGLIELFKGRIDIAGCHLFDPEFGIYNRPFITRLLPHEDVSLVHFVQRWQGFIVPKGNPRGITHWEDFLSGKYRIANRQKGSGTRILLDFHLQKLGLTPTCIPGYEREERNHFATASAVLRGEVDVVLGIESAARQLGLDFVPIEKEPYDFAIPTLKLQEQPFQTLLEVLQNPLFQQTVISLGGYDMTLSGQITRLS
ncbi:MAG TPA: helix-turn-helix transcriptional regulator [Bacillota bacterium]|nr:helix-turn-helix transcriptional regulator [Bacillota bacterium]